MPAHKPVAAASSTQVSGTDRSSYYWRVGSDTVRSATFVTHVPQHTKRHIPEDHKVHINLLGNDMPHIFVLALFNSDIQDEIAGRVARTEERKMNTFCWSVI
jgi:hypothetical protein